MALMDDILTQLSGMGFGTETYMGIGDIDPQTISTKLKDYFQLDTADIPAHMFQGISSDVLRSGLASSYSPQIEASGASMLGKLQETLGGEQAAQAYGGFAGSGQQQAYTQSAKDVYGKGMSDVLAQTGQQQIQGLQNVQDIMNQWRDTALQLKGLG